MFQLADIYPLYLLALCIWREARGESVEAKRGVAWAIRNRVTHPGWWGDTWVHVILKPWQFSSFNAGDPNSIKFPSETDNAWQACLVISAEVFEGQGTDPVLGADHYHDVSIEPPAWTREKKLIASIGALRFYK